MDKKVLVILFLVLSTGISFSQEEYLFLGEGREEEVRLFWTPTESWDENLVGFNIKRKSTDEWVKLNTAIIAPGTSDEKDISILGLSNDVVQRLAQKRSDLISAGTLKSIPTQELKDLMASKNNIESISIMLNSDFDIALIAGFGVIDSNIPKINGSYSYGLFPVYNNGEASEPVEVFEWKYGSLPNIAVKMEGDAKANEKRETVELIYKIDTESYKSYDILNGFNVLRKKEGDEEFERLNSNPIWISLKQNKATLYYKDENADLNETYIYAIAPNTIFNTNGTPVEIKVEPPVEINESIKAPILATPERRESTGKLQLKWQFEPSYEESINGFYVQLKEKDGNVFNNISPLLESNSRSFEYDLPPANDEYYHFRLIAIRKDELELWSNRKIFYNKINTIPGPPQNLQGTVEDGMIKLNWDQPNENANKVVKYNLYTSSPNENSLLREGSLEIITTNHNYQIYRSKSAVYKFAVSASNAEHQESVLSDTLSITVPSESLPFVNIWPVSKEGASVTLNWKYPEDISDLAGFRLYQNGEIILDQAQINSEQRTLVVSDLEPGQYSFELEAISVSGVTSDKSKPRTFEIE